MLTFRALTLQAQKRTIRYPLMFLFSVIKEQSARRQLPLCLQRIINSFLGWREKQPAALLCNYTWQSRFIVKWSRKKRIKRLWCAVDSLLEEGINFFFKNACGGSFLYLHLNKNSELFFIMSVSTLQIWFCWNLFSFSIQPIRSVIRRNYLNL